jgi:hypothetical protein
MTPEPISTAYFINPFHPVYLYAYPLIVARQRLGKKVVAATDTHTIIKEFLDASFSMQSVSYQRKVDRWMDGRLAIIYMDKITEKKDLQAKSYGPGVTIMH